MQAVDFPLDTNERLTCFENPVTGRGFVTSFGDDLLDQCDVPAGGTLEVVTQPTLGTVEFSPDATSWEFIGASPWQPLAQDSFTYRVKDNQGGFSDPATVRLEMAGS